MVIFHSYVKLPEGILQVPHEKNPPKPIETPSIWKGPKDLPSCQVAKSLRARWLEDSQEN